MKQSRLAALAAVGGAALLLAACGGGTQISSGNSPARATPAVTPQAANTLKVEKAGFGGKVSSGIPFWTAGAFLRNMSATDLAGTITVQATAYGADGKVVGTGTRLVNSVHAGQTMPVAISIASATAAPARVQVLASPGFWTKDPNPKAVITGGDVAISPNSDTQYIVNATLTNGLDRNLSHVTAYAVCTDEAGNINDAGSGSVELLPASGQTGVQIVSYGPVPTSCQVAGVA